MNASLKKVTWSMLLFLVVVVSMLPPLFQWHQASGVHQAVADIRRTMREQGFKTDLADFNHTNDAATQARVEMLTVFVNGPELNSANGQLNLLPADTNGAATIIWKQELLKTATNDVHWSDLHAILDTNLWALDMACDAALGGPICFDREASRGISMFGPGMFGMEPIRLQTLSEMLDLRILLDLHEGNREVAWTNLLAATRLVTACKAEPTGLSQCAQVGMVGTAFAETWQVLQKGNWPEEKLAALQKEWESADLFTNLIESTVIDYTNDVQNCRLLLNHWGPFSLSTLVGQCLEMPATAYDEIKGRGALLLYSHYGLFVDEKGLMLFFQRRALELRRALQATNWAEMRALPGVTKVVQYVSSYPDAADQLQINHGLDDFMLALSAKAEAQRRVIITAIALERYRARHGAYPATLALLAPDFFKTVPEDFMDGQPLRYRPTNDGHFVLYSVGFDFKDDGGVAWDPSPYQWIQNLWPATDERTNLDIVWPRPDASRTTTNGP
jgi:hypothetical protein